MSTNPMRCTLFGGVVVPLAVLASPAVNAAEPTGARQDAAPIVIAQASNAASARSASSVATPEAFPAYQRGVRQAAAESNPSPAPVAGGHRRPPERLRLGDRLRVDLRCAEDLETAKLPPMMVLPLLDGALAHVGGHAAATIHMSARRDAVSLAIDLRFTGAAAWSDEPDVLNAIRERLAALYGGKATLTFFGQDAGTIEGRLELPLEFDVAPASLSTSAWSEASSLASPE